MNTPSDSNTPALILASASPRRAELLQQVNVAFSQIAVDIDESIHSGESVYDYAKRMAVEKAECAWQQYGHNESQDNIVILAADTCGEVDDTLLCKPSDYEDAKRLLGLLSGTTHRIYSSFALYDGQSWHCEVVSSEVSMRPLSEDDIYSYWHTGEPCDKAGAYAIQGQGTQFISHLSGSYSAVMGLPLFEVCQALKHYHIKVL